MERGVDFVRAAEIEHRREHHRHEGDSGRNPQPHFQLPADPGGDADGRHRQKAGQLQRQFQPRAGSDTRAPCNSECPNMQGRPTSNSENVEWVQGGFPPEVRFQSGTTAGRKRAIVARQGVANAAGIRWANRFATCVPVGFGGGDRRVGAEL